MSHRDDMPDDNSSFDAYLKRGSALSGKYQELPQDTVPPELDQKILMQARDAVSNKKIVTHPSWWTKWNKPLALAATLMLACTVMYKVGHQSINELATPASPAPIVVMQSQAVPTTTIAAPPSEKHNEVAANNAPTEKSLLKESRAERHQQPVAPSTTRITNRLSEPKLEAPQYAPSSVPATSMQAPAPAIHAEEKASAKTAGALAKNDTQVVDSITAEDIGKFPDQSVATPLQRIAGVEITARAKLVNDKKQETSPKTEPEALLQHIRELRQQGKQQEADKAWQQFQKDWPDYPVTDDDVARSVKK